MGGLRTQEITLLQSTWCSCQHCDSRGEENGQVHASRFVHAEDAYEASNESGQEGSLRKSGHGEGEASKKNCKGLPSEGIEDQHLRFCVRHLTFCAFVSIIDRRASSGVTW